MNTQCSHYHFVKVSTLLGENALGFLCEIICPRVVYIWVLNLYVLFLWFTVCLYVSTATFGDGVFVVSLETMKWESL